MKICKRMQQWRSFSLRKVGCIVVNYLSPFYFLNNDFIVKTDGVYWTFNWHFSRSISWLSSSAFRRGLEMSSIHGHLSIAPESPEESSVLPSFKTLKQNQFYQHQTLTPMLRFCWFKKMNRCVHFPDKSERRWRVRKDTFSFLFFMTSNKNPEAICSHSTHQRLKK